MWRNLLGDEMLGVVVDVVVMGWDGRCDRSVGGTMCGCRRFCMASLRGVIR